jgi:hypothetical protein
MAILTVAKARVVLRLISRALVVLRGMDHTDPRVGAAEQRLREATGELHAVELSALGHPEPKMEGEAA